MDKIIMLVLALTTFIAYPFLSGDGRKQVAPLSTPIDDTTDPEELDDDDEPISMEDDDDQLSD